MAEHEPERAPARGARGPALADEHERVEPAEGDRIRCHLGGRRAGRLALGHENGHVPHTNATPYKGYPAVHFLHAFAAPRPQGSSDRKM
eukprot:4638225-Prymnesium_polylepis.1